MAEYTDQAAVAGFFYSFRHIKYVVTKIILYNWSYGKVAFTLKKLT